MRLLVTPGAILRWQRGIVGCRWARLSRWGRSGRPTQHRKVRSVVLRLARENESRGYRRIQGELAGLGITVAPSTVWQILKSAGINRAPRQGGPSWAEFRARHPPHPHPRSHRASGPVVGSAAGPELAHGPGKRRDTGEVCPARPGRQRNRSTWRQFLRTQASSMLACRLAAGRARPRSGLSRWSSSSVRQSAIAGASPLR